MTINNNSFNGSEDIIVLHGDDELAIQEDITSLIRKGGDLSGLNTSRFDGKVHKTSDIFQGMRMLPMGFASRKIIVENAQEILKNKNGKEWLLETLENFPPSAQLILILDDQRIYKKGSMVWVRFPGSHWTRKAIHSFSGEAAWVERLRPDAKQMPQWILEKAKALGGNFHPAAAHTLANLVGSDLFQAQQEIEKAIAYTGGHGQVSAEDIRLLCAASKEESIFSLVDAVGMRDGRTATRLFREMSVDMSAQYIFSMLVRQVRLLLQASTVLAVKGSSRDVVIACDIRSEWQAKKLMNQARRFTTNELFGIYNNLDRIDEESKVGHVAIETAIETFLVSATSK